MHIEGACNAHSSCISVAFFLMHLQCTLEVQNSSQISAPALDLPPHSGSPTTQDPVFAWTSNTRLASPILTEDTSGMVKSATDDETGTAPDVRPARKPLAAKVIVMGSISTTDIDFLSWRGVHCPRLGVRDAMLMYVRYLNGEEKIRFEQEMEQWKTYMRSKLSPEQRKELEGLKARNDALSLNIKLCTKPGTKSLSSHLRTLPRTFPSFKWYPTPRTFLLP